MNPAWKERLNQDLPFPVVNRSVFGCTIEKAAPRLRTFLSSPQTDEKELVLLEFGGNDCDYDWSAIAENPESVHRCKTKLEGFLSLYRGLLEEIRQSGREPLVATLPPIDSRRYFDYFCRSGLDREQVLHWLKNVEDLGRWQELYSCAVFQLAREEQAELLDFRSAFLSDPDKSVDLSDLLCDDGIHPSPAGQDILFRTLKEKCESLASRTKEE